MEFDQVVFACHGDQVLPLLEQPTGAESDVLGSFKTSRNIATLHTDASLLPSRLAARASWNYNLGMDRKSCGRRDLSHEPAAVPQDGRRLLRHAQRGRCHRRTKVLRKIVYHHPLYTHEAIRAQDRWSEISGRNRTHYCGAYWFYGFHEDGLNSALRVARALSVEC